MAQQLGAAAPPVQLRVEATTICFSEDAAPAGQFTVSVACVATRCFEFWRHDAQRAQHVVEQNHPAGRTMTTFTVADLAALQSAAACRGTLRGMLAELPQLRSLRLVDDEWDAIVPEDIVPEIVRVARLGNGFTFYFSMVVDRRVIHDEGVLLMACKERMAPGEKRECTVCLDGLEQESVVELPGCQHMFHRRCISMWFSTATTCPICRGNVWRASLPEFS